MGEYVCSMGIELVEGMDDPGVLRKLVPYELSRHVNVWEVCA